MSHENYKRYMSSRRNGFGMNLYRNVKNKKIGGVCAGIADHFEIDHNIMRIIFVAAAIFSSSLAIWGYIIAWIVMVPNRNGEEKDNYEYDEKERCYRKKKIFRYRENASERLRGANNRMKETLARVEAMEQYVTSKKFSLNRQFADLEK